MPHLFSISRFLRKFLLNVYLFETYRMLIDDKEIRSQESVYKVCGLKLLEISQETLI